MRFAQAMARLGTETAFSVLAKARALEAQGRDVVHLEIGEPDFDTPAHIVEAAVKALHDGYTHYTPAAGLPAVREVIADYVSRTRGVPVLPSQVLVTPGGKPVMFYAILALVDPGDEVIMPNPSFPIYESMVNYVGGKPVPVALRIENEFRFDLDELRARVTPRTKMLILNSPANPTGGMLSKEDVAAIAELAIAHDLVVLTDEIYSRILYDGQAFSILSVPGMAERTILLDGFSKTYAMTGWRLGYGIAPEVLTAAMTTMQVNATSCTNAATQMAGMAALTGPQECVEQMVRAFRERRDVIVEGLNQVPGFRCANPRGAFYVFPQVSGTGMGSDELASYLLNEGGVAVLSGTAFGAYGEGYLRISYANSIENIRKALGRIKEAVEKLQD